MEIWKINVKINGVQIKEWAIYATAAEVLDQMMKFTPWGGFEYDIAVEFSTPELAACAWPRRK